MKFLVDAQLPRRLAVRLNELGFDAVHTLDLPDQNRTPDQGITTKADLENRVVISKDADFVNSHLIVGAPRKLLLISTGNITNVDLLALLETNLEQIVLLLASSHFLELSRTALIAHD